MADLRCLAGLTSADWAAWVQAVGSVAAIGVAIAVAAHQSKSQHASAMEVFQAQNRAERADAARTLAVLAANSARALRKISEQIPDRQAVHEAADGLRPCAVGELKRIDDYLRQIPLHSLPDSLVTLTMALGSVVRQSTLKIESAISLHRNMDAAMFDDFFRTLQEMNESLSEIAARIDSAARRD